MTSGSPLLTAVQDDDLLLVQNLLNSGANPDRGNFYMTPLFLSIIDNRCEIFLVLLDHNADVNLQLCGGSAVKYAIKYGRVEMLKKLHSLGAILKSEDFDIAISQREVKCAEFLLTEYSNNTKLEMVKKNHYVREALLSNNVGMVRLLCRHGWEYFSDSEDCFDVVSQLVKGDCSKVLALLGNDGVDFNVENRFGMTPLLWCSDYHVGSDTLKVLLDHGALVNHTCNLGGDSALLLCSQKANLEKVKLLIKYGADPNLKNKYGQSPLDVASESGYDRVVQYLLESGAETNTNFHNYHISVSDTISVHLLSVKTLQHLTRLSIRTRILENGHHVNVIGDFPLPKPLKNYLLFQEV